MGGVSPLLTTEAKIVILDDKTFVAGEVGGRRRNVFYRFGWYAGVDFPFLLVLFCEYGTCGEEGVGGEGCAAEDGDAC